MDKPSIDEKALEGRDLNYEKDSLHILPLHMVPLQTPGLRQARMLKNANLESAVEVFHGDETGSGQIDPSRLGGMFDWPPGEKHPDALLVAKLSLMQSFDIYTLRMQLRQMGLNIENSADLKLSSAKTAELKKHMTAFMQPLVKFIYDQTGLNPQDIGIAAASIQQNNDKAALGNLKLLSDKFKIILEQLPEFLGSYGDVFLSLAYFKKTFEDQIPQVIKFQKQVAALKKEESLQNDDYFQAAADTVCDDMREIMSMTAKRFGSFDEHTASMWENINAKSFQKVKILIESNHGILGGVLCGLFLKLRAWEEHVSTDEINPRRLADFIVSDMKHGVGTIKMVARSAQAHAAFVKEG